MEYLYAFLIFAGLAFLFVLLYILNSKTKKPDDCQDVSSECEGCHVAICHHNPNHKKEEK